MKVLVCGGRHFWHGLVLEKLSALHEFYPISEIVHGAANGADFMGMLWAELMSIPHTPFPAEWSLYGKRAGMIRNQRMLKENPDIVLAFPGGRGTANMAKIAKKAGVLTVNFGKLYDEHGEWRIFDNSAD